MDPKNRRLYTGHSGQRAVMAELLHRGCNVAVPEVDVGRDLYAFQDDEEDVTHIQVKTAGNARPRKTAGCYSAQIDVPLRQLQEQDIPPLHYAFAMRLKDRWADYLIISRPRLKNLWSRKGIGTSYTDRNGNALLKLHFSFTPDAVTCGGEDFQPYRNAWTSLPPLHGMRGQAGTPPPQT
ncbi:MAG TPA: hypothetical protein VJ739_13550 [Gemmataceae bacterium]|nr:hypothetical protein [Gemmataceae bacterium]